MKIDALRTFVTWFNDGKPGKELHTLGQHDFDEFLTYLKTSTGPSTTRMCVAAIRELHLYSNIVTGGGLPFRPWNDISTLSVSGQKFNGELATPVIPPEVWWPLLRACWQYIDVFSADLLAANAEWSRLQDRTPEPRIKSHEINTMLDQWLTAPNAYVPVHRLTYGRFKTGEIHWTLLSLLFTNGRSPNALSDAALPHVEARRQRIIAAVSNSTVPTSPGGLSTPITHIERADGSTGPWIDGMDPATVREQLKVLRNACYVFCAALSMMRDSELQSIHRGSLTTHFGAPAIKSELRKRQRGKPERNWWIIEPVAKAISVAEKISTTVAIFGSSRKNHDATNTRMRGFDQRDELGKFIHQLNSLGPASGLEKIPDFHLSPHMFRRTMAIITAQQPDGEIALGLQLKHAARRAVANGTTGGYAAETAEWAKEFEHELQESVAAKLIGLWSGNTTAESIILGSGAQRLKDRMDSVRADYNSTPTTVKVKIGDERLLRDLLRDEFSTFRWGTLNHCLGIAEQAACLEGVPAEVAGQGMIPNRCQPTTCRNSVVTDQHLPIWIAEEQDLMAKLKDRKMAAHNREQLESELATVQTLTRKVTHGSRTE